MHYVRAKYVMFGQNLHVVFHNHNIVCNQVVGFTLQIRQIQDSIHNHRWCRCELILKKRSTDHPFQIIAYLFFIYMNLPEILLPSKNSSCVVLTVGTQHLVFEWLYKIRRLTAITRYMLVHMLVHIFQKSVFLVRAISYPLKREGRGLVILLRK